MMFTFSNQVYSIFFIKVESGVLLFVLLLRVDAMSHILKTTQFRGNTEVICEYFWAAVESAGQQLLLFNYFLVHIKPKVVFIMKQIEFHGEHFQQFLESCKVIN